MTYKGFEIRKVYEVLDEYGRSYFPMKSIAEAKEMIDFCRQQAPKTEPKRSKP